MDVYAQLPLPVVLNDVALNVFLLSYVKTL